MQFRRREAGSRSHLDDVIFLDSGSRFATRRSSGMTGLSYDDTISSAGMTYRSVRVEFATSVIKHKKEIKSENSCLPMVACI